MQGMTHDIRRFASLAALAALTLAVGTLCALRATAQSATGDPKATEQWTPVPPVVAPGAAIGSTPSDAIILFDGRNLDEWVSTQDHSPARWKIGHGMMTVDKTLGTHQCRNGAAVHPGLPGA